MKMAWPGALRGAAAAVVLVLAVVTLPILLAGEATFAPLTLSFVVLAGLVGAVCGTIAGRLLDNGYTWRRAAVVSTAAALLAVAGVMAVFGGGRIGDNTSGVLVLGLVLGGGASAVAVWQSWAMARRQDRSRPVS